MVAVIVWLFPFVRTALAHYGFPDDLLVIGYTGSIVILDIAEVAGNAISGESNSAWDEDLNLTVEGAAQALLMEEVAASPRRIWLFNLAVVLFALMFLVLWKLPAGLALVALALIDSSIAVGMWRFGLFHLRACFVE